MKVTSNTHLYLPFPRYGVLKHEVCVFCDILTDIITLGREQEVLVGIVGQRWGRCGGHRLVAGIPAPVAASGTAVASRQHFFPGPAGWLWDCLKNTHTRINTIDFISTLPVFGVDNNLRPNPTAEMEIKIFKRLKYKP